MRRGKSDKQRIRELERHVERLEDAVAILAGMKLMTRDKLYCVFPEPHPYAGIKRRVLQRIWDRADPSTSKEGE